MDVVGGGAGGSPSGADTSPGGMEGFTGCTPEFGGGASVGIDAGAAAAPPGCRC